MLEIKDRKKMLPLHCYISHPNVLLESLLRKYGGWIPDKQYLQMLYYLKMHKRLNLDNPQTFSEKIQWLKLYNRRPEYTMMVDKLAVKDYVAGIIGSEYIIPTLGVWDRPEDIDFDSLPNEFVLKTTHGGGGGGVVICKDKLLFDKKGAINKLRIAMKQDIYKKLREWPYKNVKRRIIAEKYIEEALNPRSDLKDYKFYCFNGIPKFCQVIGERRIKETIDFFDMEWTHQDFCGLCPADAPLLFEPAKMAPLQPLHYKKMREVARMLSYGIPFCRIDLYDTPIQAYFGEITFYPASGLGVFTPSKYNGRLGEMITLL